MVVTLFRRGLIYCDNQSVVDAFQRLLEQPFDIFTWRTHPNLDLWSEITSTLAAKGPSSFQIDKVKAHRSVHHANGLLDQWTITGNDKADSLAKKSIFDYLESIGLSSKALRDQELFNLTIAEETSKMLHHLSIKAFALRKEREQLTTRTQAEAEHEEAAEHPPPSEELPPHQPSADLPKTKWDVPPPWMIPNPTWSPQWLYLVCHYFSKLSWPDPQERQPGCISLLEIMLDLFISFQTCGPVNIRGNKTRVKVALPPDVPPGKMSYYYLPDRNEQKQLPNLLITQASHTWLLTLKYLEEKLGITPFRLETASLNLFGYTNVVPSLSIRPTLLNGNLTSQLLSETLVPGRRSLKYHFRLPPAPSLPWPDCFPDRYRV